MQTKILVIGVVKKDNSILMRKKPDGSPPYKETWYLFGVELPDENSHPENLLVDWIKEQTGIGSQVVERLSWDTEIKTDLDGVEKRFVYLDVLLEYVDGDFQPAAGIEKLEWIPIDQLDLYDIVPPSMKLFKKLGYIG